MKEKRSFGKMKPSSVLLNLDGEIFPMDNGYWLKFEVWQGGSEPHVPRGVRYSLTLHDRLQPAGLWVRQRSRHPAGEEGYAARKITWDHRHKCGRISPYEYESASRLLEDFWREVEDGS